MKKTHKLVIAGILLLTTIIFAISDNEVIYPSALVGFLLILTLLGDKSNDKTGKAAQYTIITFAVLVIAFNILSSAFIPIIADNIDLTEHFEEETTDIGAETNQEMKDHFVQVFLNDVHELCFAASFILIINGIFLFIFNRKNHLGGSYNG